MAIAITILGGSLAGCNREKQTTGEGRSPEAEPPGERVAPEAAVDAMAEARCDYEQRCGKIGASREYADTEHCLTRFKTDFQKELNTWDCPGGINKDELGDCLTEIRNNDCNSPIEDLERVVACRSSDLCEDTER